MNDYQYELIKENSSKLLKTIDAVEKTVDMLGTKTSRVLRPISPRYKNRKNRQINPVKRKYESLQGTGKLSDLINVDNQHE